MNIYNFFIIYNLHLIALNKVKELNEEYVIMESNDKITVSVRKRTELKKKIN